MLPFYGYPTESRRLVRPLVPLVCLAATEFRISLTELVQFEASTLLLCADASSVS